MFSIQMLRLDVIKIVFQYVFESCLNRRSIFMDSRSKKSILLLIICSLSALKNIIPGCRA